MLKKILLYIIIIIYKRKGDINGGFILLFVYSRYTCYHNSNIRCNAWNVFCYCYSFLCIALVALMLVTDLNFHPKIRWTLFTAGGVATMWIASSIGFFKRYNLLKNLMWQLLIGTIISFIWDALTGWHSWSVHFVLPLMSVGILLAMCVIAKVQKSPVREYLIYEIMAAGYGLILPGILLFCKVVKRPTVSMFGALACFLFLVGVLLFKGREFKEEMQKNLHV